jgi:type IV pilus assembly protein PilV
MRNIKIRQTQQLNSLARQKGAGMIEVLVTLVILSVGLLGVASLQFVGSFASKEALARTQAIMVSAQITERLRASAVASRVTDGFVIHNNYVDKNFYNFKNLSCEGSATPYECHCLSIPAGIPNCQTGECVAADLALFDAYQMSCSVVRENPNATLEVSCNDSDTADIDACTAGSIHTIMVKWLVQSWRGDFKKSNANCNDDGNSGYDCVVKQVAL